MPQVFRLADSIATDVKFSKEGMQIWQNFALANDDEHPDANSCRMKLSLVTIDANMKSPWDLTMEAASCVVKLKHISATCKVELEEELQLLESDHILTDETKLKTPPQYRLYPIFMLKNRLSSLRALLNQGKSESQCFVPPREVAPSSVYYLDKTLLGEQYNKVIEVSDMPEWERFLKPAGDIAPPGGWLVLAGFHVLWSQHSVKLRQVRNWICGPWLPSPIFAASAINHPTFAAGPIIIQPFV